jgi:hypothetical protein
MAPSDQKYVSHLYSQSVPLREGEPGVDMPSYPLAEKSLRESILTLSRYRK